MSRIYEYINLSKPGIRSPGLSHDLQLLRDLEIVNARTAAELGLLPSGGLLVVPKRKYAPPQSAAASEYGQSNFENQKEAAMKLSKAVAAAAITTGIMACAPSAGTEEAPPPPGATATSALSPARSEVHDLPPDTAEAKQEKPTTGSALPPQPRMEAATPISANAAINEAGKLEIEAGDITLHLAASGCSKQSDTLTICGQGANLYIAKTGSNFSQTLQLKSVYVDSKETLYRGALDKSNCHTFILADVNGDGQEDLIVQTGNEGGYGGPSFSVYLFDMKDKQFKFNESFSDLTIGTSSLFIVEHGKLKTWAKNGCCEHFYLTYEIRNNRPVLTEMITERSTDKEVKTIVERLVNGEMKEIVE